jgi:hypothetical protein
MDGILDANNDVLAPLAADVGKPFAWYKTTICCFRLSELMVYFQDDGWEVRPLLMVRDVRDVWASLAPKPYGRNGITAEDPPLRVRLHRFFEDWEYFRTRGLPMLVYEEFIAEPQKVLEETCSRLGLPWDGAMMTWPKGVDDIASARHGNETFRRSRGSGLMASLRDGAARGAKAPMSGEDLAWLERRFEALNRHHGYPLHREPAAGAGLMEARAVPSFAVTRRQQWELKRRPFHWLLRSIGVDVPVRGRRGRG